MRTEYDIQITDNRGKITHSVYPKKKAEEEAPKIKKWYSENKPSYKVEFFKVQYIGNSLYKAERIF